MKYIVIINLVVLSCFSLNAQILAGGAGHILMVCKDGSVYATGANYRGEIGDSTTDTAYTFQKTLNIDSVKQVSAGFWHSIALRRDSTVWSWGGNDQGALISGDFNDYRLPQKIDSLENIISLSAGDSHNLFLRKDSTVWGGGSNRYGELAVSSASSSFNTVMRVSTISGVADISAGSNFSLLLKDNSVWAFGRNSIGQLATGDLDNSAIPVKIADLNHIENVEAGPANGYAIDTNGTVWAWGSNVKGQLGNRATIGIGQYSDIPVMVDLDSVVKVAARNSKHVLALKTDGTVWSWGHNNWGQLGDGTRTTRNKPVKVKNLKGIMHITTTPGTSMAIDSSGVIYSWGTGPNLANDTATQLLVPTPVYPAPCNPIISLPEMNKPEEIKVKVFPNPASGVFYIEAKEAVEKISVFNSRGELVLEQRGSTGEVDISDQPAGLYFLQLKTGQKIVTKKILKR